MADCSLFFPLTPGPTGLIRVDTVAGERRLRVPGPLEGPLWGKLSSIAHPQLARVELLEAGSAGALVALDPPTLPHSPSASHASPGLALPQFSSPQDLIEWLSASQGLPAGTTWSVRTAASRKGPPFFVALPIDLGSTAGWQSLEFPDPAPPALSSPHPSAASRSSTRPGPSKEGSTLAPTKRLPVHRRARFRVGAIAVASVVTLVVAAGVWLPRLGLFAATCPGPEEAGEVLEQLLQERAQALADGDLEALSAAESGELLAADQRLLEQRGEQVLEDVAYRARTDRIDCSAEGVWVSGEITAVTASCKGCVEKRSTRNFRALLSRPWRIEEFH